MRGTVLKALQLHLHRYACMVGWLVVGVAIIDCLLLLLLIGGGCGCGFGDRIQHVVFVAVVCGFSKHALER